MQKNSQKHLVSQKKAPSQPFSTSRTLRQSLIQKQFFQMLPTDFTKQDAIKTAQVLGVAEATMKRWLTKYTQSNDIQRVEQGLYRKVIA